VTLSVSGAFHPSKAGTVTWLLGNARFDIDTSISGGFIWDTDLNTPLSWNFTVLGGNNNSFKSLFLPRERLSVSLIPNSIAPIGGS
jgi:hypothetical protein